MTFTVDIEQVIPATEEATARHRRGRRRFRFVANGKAATGLVILGIFVAPRDHRPVDRAVRPGRAELTASTRRRRRHLVRHHPPRARTSSARSWSAPAASCSSGFVAGVLATILSRPRSA